MPYFTKYSVGKAVENVTYKKPETYTIEFYPTVSSANKIRIENVPKENVVASDMLLVPLFKSMFKPKDYPAWDLFLERELNVPKSKIRETTKVVVPMRKSPTQKYTVEDMQARFLFLWEYYTYPYFGTNGLHNDFKPVLQPYNDAWFDMDNDMFYKNNSDNELDLKSETNV